MTDTSSTGPDQPLTTEYVESGSGAPNPDQKPFEAITSQEDFERRLGPRLARERAKYADYDALKDKAAKFDEVEARNKSDLQKALERAEKAEKRIADAELGSLRAEVAHTKGVPVGSVKGTTREEMEASADELIAWRDGAEAERYKQSRTADGFKSGASGSTDSAMTGKERAAAALRNMRNG